MRKFWLFLLKLVIGLVVAGIAWVLFIALQQINYSVPDQVYLMGATISYAFVFLFFCVVMFFIFSFMKHRSHPQKIKRRFYIFAVFYLIGSPLVIMSFDNYLLVTPKGLAYNEFLRLEDTKVKRWKDIKEVVLDYHEVDLPFRQKNELRLRYILIFRDGTSVDLNHYNSPLYDAEDFKSIHRVIIKQGVPVKIARPLPEKVREDTFIYEMFHFQE